jgi:APA family basic amino acid/polyamine antiporter
VNGDSAARPANGADRRAWRGMFARKSMAQLRAEADASQLRRTLGRGDLTILGVGAVIGTGIFVMPGIVAARFAGPAVVLSLIVAGFAALLAALCYAEFASLTPAAGSAYTFAYGTMGELPAWIIGWGLMLEYTIGSAIVAIGWASYLLGFIDRTFHVGTYRTVNMHAAAAFAVIASTAVLCAGIRRSAYATAVFVLIKVAVILLFVFFGLPFINPSNWHPFVPAPTGLSGQYGWFGVFRGASIMFLAYIGFDAVTTAAQEARNPERDVPFGLLATVAISIVVYVALSAVLTGLVSFRELEGVSNPMAHAIHATGVRWVGFAVELGAIAGLSSVLLVLLLGQARNILAMSRDGLLPRALSSVRPESGVPFVSTVVAGAVVLGLTLVGSVEKLGEVVSIGAFSAYIIVCIGIPILRATAPDLPRTFRVPFSPFVPLAGAAACAYLMVSLPVYTLAIAGVWFAIGILIYFVGRYLRG